MPTYQNELVSEVAKYFDYLQLEKGSSPLTIRNYKHYLGRFIEFVDDSVGAISVEDISLDLIDRYRLRLAQFTDRRGRGLSKKTQGFHMIAMRSFLKWLAKRDKAVISSEKIELPKVEDRQIKFLTGEQIDRLLNAPSLSTIVGKRDKAILEVLFSTGLRVSELTGLNRGQIDFDRREFGIVGKGGRARVVFLSTRAADWLQLYLKARKDHYGPLFIRHRGKVDADMDDEDVRISPRSLQRMVKKYVRKVKLPVDATPHIIRHSYATDLLMAGADIRSVQEMLGHKNIVTTQVYTHVTNKRMREVHEAYHGKKQDEEN